MSTLLNIVIWETQAHPTINVQYPSVYLVNEPGPQGPPGPTGPPGSGAVAFDFTCTTAIESLRAVMVNDDGELTYPSSSSVITAGRCIGVTRTGAGIGEDAEIIPAGAFSSILWNWNINQPVFIGIDGALTQNLPTTGYVQEVGTAYSSTGLIVNIKQAYLL